MAMNGALITNETRVALIKIRINAHISAQEPSRRATIQMELSQRDFPFRTRRCVASHFGGFVNRRVRNRVTRVELCC